MDEILDYDENEITTNYRKWSFRFFIYLVLLFGLGFYLIPSNSVTFENFIFSQKILILAWVFKIFLCIGIFFMIMMIRNNETRDYKFWISLIGISLFFMASVAFSFI